MTISIKVNGAIEKLHIVSTTLNRDRLLNIIGTRMLRWVNKNFRDQGTEQRWRALSKNTLATPGRGIGAQILRNSGRMAQSFAYEVSRDSVWTGTRSKIAPHHHFGTGPYTIRPKAGKMLRFFTAGGGATFAREVHHPGLAKRPLLPSKGLTKRIVVDAVTAHANSHLAGL